MGLRQLRKFRFECDGFTPTGKKCSADLDMESVTTFEAEQRARNIGWKHEARGWICSVKEGHRVP